jgi:hypothetical protein
VPLAAAADCLQSLLRGALLKGLLAHEEYNSTREVASILVETTGAGDYSRARKFQSVARQAGDLPGIAGVNYEVFRKQHRPMLAGVEQPFQWCKALAIEYCKI